MHADNASNSGTVKQNLALYWPNPSILRGFPYVAVKEMLWHILRHKTNHHFLLLSPVSQWLVLSCVLFLNHFPHDTLDKASHHHRKTHCHGMPCLPGVSTCIQLAPPHIACMRLRYGPGPALLRYRTITLYRA